MKIDTNQGSDAVRFIQQPNPPEKHELSQEVKKQEPSGDKVELSAQSKEIKKINDALEMTPDVRAEKVAALKELVQKGEYKVDSNKLADKMINESIIDLIK